MDSMKYLKKPGKTDMLLNIFDEVGTSMSVRDVCDITEIKGYNSLKALFSYIRKASHIPAENRIDVRIKDDVCIRVN